MGNVDIEKIIQRDKKNVEKTLNSFLYSLNKITKMNVEINLEDLESLETWESFTFRFSRLSDILVKNLMRSLILRDDPSFRGSDLDFLNIAEQSSYISNANRWWSIRALRNKEANEYIDEDLENYFKTVKVEADFLISETQSLLKKT